ncbi:hypothetical protein KJ996_00810 [Patescibacteria group bacterium]|nr:hypothetical protein [Patescibacteria group bacterium]
MATSPQFFEFTFCAIIRGTSYVPHESYKCSDTGAADVKKHMTQTSFSQSPVGPTMGHIFKRVALPFLLFSAVLFGFLTLSWYLLLPKLTTIEVAGQQRNAMQLKKYVVDLQANVLEMEDVRRELVTPLRSGLYGAAKEFKSSVNDPLSLRSQIFEIAADLVSGQNDVIDINILRYNQSKGTLHLEGAVQNVGPRSMTILAQFVEALKELEWVSDVNLPRFTRELDREKGYFSPFVFQLKLNE